MKKKSILALKTFSLALSLGLAASTSFPVIAGIKQPSQLQKNTTNSETLLAQRRSRLRFLRGRVNASRRRTGGFSRGTYECNGQEVTVTPLLPKLNEEELLAKKQIAVESTVKARPKFYVYVGETNAKNAEFLILNESGDRIIYEEMIDLTNTPGIISVSLPEDADPLEVDQLYHWHFSVICDPNGIDRTGDVLVDGWVKRIEMEPSLETQLAQAEPRDRPNIYADAGIWTETISTLAELRQANPDDTQIEEDWVSLLGSVELDIKTDAPVIETSSNPEDSETQAGY